MKIIDLGWPWRPLRAIAAKRCEIGPKLLWITNTKSYIGFQMKWKSSTLDNLEGHWQPVRSAILATAGFLFGYVVVFWLIDWLIDYTNSTNQQATIKVLTQWYSRWNDNAYHHQTTTQATDITYINDVMWSQKSRVVTPISLRPHISIIVQDRRIVLIDHQ